MRVLVADKFEESGIGGLRAIGCEVFYHPELVGEPLGEALRSSEADVLVVRSTLVTEPMLAGSRLAVILRAGAGVNTIDVPAASRRGIAVTNCPGTNAAAVAELTMGLILSLDRRIPDNVGDLRTGRWNKAEYSKAKGLSGRTLGLIGFGKIAQAVAVRAQAFGMSVIACSRRFSQQSTSASDGPDGMNVDVVSVPEVLAERSDVVSVHLALTDETKRSIGASIFNRMKQGAYFVNTSRGEIVDETALAEAVKERQLRVALDVFSVEPAGATGEFESALIGLPNVYGTHHIGASTQQAQEAIAAETVRIVGMFKDTGKVLNAVNLSTMTPAW